MHGLLLRALAEGKPPGHWRLQARGPVQRQLCPAIRWPIIASPRRGRYLSGLPCCGQPDKGIRRGPSSLAGSGYGRDWQRVRYQPPAPRVMVQPLTATDAAVVVVIARIHRAATAR